MNIGIYGGTFNPPHLGHVTAARYVMDLLGLERLYLIPDSIPPHKDLPDSTPAPEHRLELARLAAGAIGNRAQVLDLELRRGGMSYTADTVAELHARHPDDHLWLLMGADMFLTFHRWKDPDRILSHVGLAAFGRSEADMEELFSIQREYLERTFPQAHIFTLTVPGVLDLSSTELRERLAFDGKAGVSGTEVGAVGKTGVSGTDGGADGKAGVSGTDGGADGKAGVSGTDDGADGKAGVSGTDGGAVGCGADGKTGDSGTDGGAKSRGKGGAAHLLPPAVYGYILREGLYGTSADLKHLPLPLLRACALSHLDGGRVPHVLGTEQTAVRLAVRYGADTEQARKAALFHDCTKRLSNEEQFRLCEKYRIEPGELERDNGKLLHSKTGAALAADLYGLEPDCVEAIRWHTTGRANMTTLDKIMYIADYIEPSRNFPGVEELRARTDESLDAGVKLGLEMTVRYVERRGLRVHPDTLAALDAVRGSI